MAANPAQVRRNAATASRSNRPFFRLKSDWAEWEAAKIEEAIREMESRYIPSSKWSQVRQKASTLSSMREQAAKWRSRARSYRAAGN